MKQTYNKFPRKQRRGNITNIAPPTIGLSNENFEEVQEGYNEIDEFAFQQDELIERRIEPINEIEPEYVDNEVALLNERISNLEEVIKVKDVLIKQLIEAKVPKVQSVQPIVQAQQVAPQQGISQAPQQTIVAEQVVAQQEVVELSRPTIDTGVVVDPSSSTNYKSKIKAPNKVEKANKSDMDDKLAKLKDLMG